MIKILIVVSDMKVGGIQKSLIELLKVLEKQDEYDVTLFCSRLTGSYLKQVPKKIHILVENPYAKASEQDLKACKNQGFKYYIFRLFSTVWSKLFGKGLPAKVLCRKIGMIGDSYDVAISYSQPIEDHEFCNLTNEIIIHCSKAKRKIAFIHCDYASYGGNTRRNRKLYYRFDAIAAVSDSVGRRFSHIIPGLSERIYTVYNFCDVDEIIRLSEIDSIEYSNPCVVTVARLSKEKGLLRCVPIFARLRDEGVIFEWHIVGDGNLYRVLSDLIAANNLNEQIVLEGEQTNPYRYIKNADFFFLPSSHEAAPMVFDEASSLGIPILTTNTLSSAELVSEKKIGFVCDNNEDAIYKMLYKALTLSLQHFEMMKPNQEISLQQFICLCNGTR